MVSFLVYQLTERQQEQDGPLRNERSEKESQPGSNANDTVLDAELSGILYYCLPFRSSIIHQPYP